MAYVPLALAVLLTWMLARQQSSTFDSVRLVDPGLTSVEKALGMVAAISACFATLLAPGLLAMRALRKEMDTAPEVILASLVLSSFVVAGAWSGALAVVSGEAGRACFYQTIAALDAALLLGGLFSARSRLFPRRARESLPWLLRGSKGQHPPVPAKRFEVSGPGARELAAILAAVATAAFVAWLALPAPLTVRVTDPYAVRNELLAASLWEGPIPSVRGEPQRSYAAYAVFLGQAILGESPAAVRLPAIVMFGALLLASVALAVSRASPLSFRSLATLSLGAAAIASVAVRHHDPGGFLLETHSAAAFAVCALVFRRDYLVGLLAGSLALLSLPSHEVFFGTHFRGETAMAAWRAFGWFAGLGGTLPLLAASLAALERRGWFRKAPLDPESGPETAGFAEKHRFRG
jgi:hypothetical protein